MKVMEERARVPLFLTYRAVGSGTGQKEFVGNAANMHRGWKGRGVDVQGLATSNNRIFGWPPFFVKCG